MKTIIPTKEDNLKVLKERLDSGYYTLEEYESWIKTFYPTPIEKKIFKQHVADCLHGLN
jgi:hypothetical protein